MQYRFQDEAEASNHDRRQLELINAGRAKIALTHIEKLFAWANEKGYHSMEPQPNPRRWFWHLCLWTDPEMLRMLCVEIGKRRALPTLEMVTVILHGIRSRAVQKRQQCESDHQATETHTGPEADQPVASGERVSGLAHWVSGAELAAGMQD